MIDSKTNTAKILELLQDCNPEIEFEQLAASELVEFANQKGRLPELFQVYRTFAPKESKLKTYYNFMNMQANLSTDCNQDGGLAGKISDAFLSHYLNFGKKYILVDTVDVDKFDVKTLAQKANAKKSKDLFFEKNQLFNQDAGDLAYLHVTHHAKDKKGNFIFFLRETIGDYSYETPAESFLTEAGIQIKNSLLLKKQTIIPGIHKVIFSADFKYRISLIDPSTLVRNETAADKAINCIAHVLKYLDTGIEAATNSKPVYFFKAIQKLYDDPTIGFVTEGYFATSSGSNFNSKTKTWDSDLRKDPFQKGGESADKGNLSFTKIRIAWDESNLPRIFLNGSSDMFNKADKSLPFVKITFDFHQPMQINFLEKVLQNADW